LRGERNTRKIGSTLAKDVREDRPPDLELLVKHGEQCGSKSHRELRRQVGEKHP
jgi:hypothetical protein